MYCKALPFWETAAITMSRSLRTDFSAYCKAWPSRDTLVGFEPNEVRPRPVGHRSELACRAGYPASVRHACVGGGREKTHGTHTGVRFKNGS